MDTKEQITITIYKDEGLEVTPQVAEMSGGAVVTFVAEEVTAKVYVPDPVLVPVDSALDRVDSAEIAELVFEVAPGKPATYHAVDDNVVVEYFVTREIFGGFTEAVAIPPVMIIKKSVR